MLSFVIDGLDFALFKTVKSGTTADAENNGLKRVETLSTGDFDIAYTQATLSLYPGSINASTTHCSRKIRFSCIQSIPLREIYDAIERN